MFFVNTIAWVLLRNLLWKFNIDLLHIFLLKDSLGPDSLEVNVSTQIIMIKLLTFSLMTYI